MVVSKSLSEALGGKTTGLAVDVYRKSGQTVAMSFWGDAPMPLAFFKAVRGGEGLFRSGLLANDDVPAYDERKSLVRQRVESAHWAGEKLISVVLADEVGNMQHYSSIAPEDSVEVNYFPLVESLNEALSSLDGGSVQDAASLLQNISREWRERNIQFRDADPARNIVAATAAMADQLNAGEGGVGEALCALRDQITQSLPDFRLVLIDETGDWADEELVSRAGKIWAAYLYDANRATHLAEITPSYELHYLYSTAEGDLPEGDQETLLIHGGPEGAHYMHCRAIDRMDWSRKHACGTPSEPGADSYQALVESEIEHYRANCAIDCPQPLSDQRIAREALTLLGQGRDNADDVTRLLESLSPAVRQEVAAYQAGASLGDALSSYLGGLEARREFATALVGENVSLEGAQLASRFHSEVMEQFETVASVGEQFGQRTVADLFYLQTAILRSGQMDAWPQSSIIDVVEKLPSAEKWLTYTRPCNRYGEPAPRHDVSDAVPVMR